MNIEAELPSDFDDLSDEEKIEELEALKEELGGDSDPDVMKRRLIEELIDTYR